MKLRNLFYWLLIVCLFILTACGIFEHQASEKQTKSILLDLFSYVPASLVDYHPGDIYGSQVNYFDFDSMAYDLDLPDEKGANEWKSKLALVTGYQYQGLAAFPKHIDAINYNSFETLGWDFSDVSQSLYLVQQDTAILRGDFDIRHIEEVLNAQNYHSMKTGAFTIYTSEEDEYCYGVSDETLIIATSADDVDVLIWQYENSQSSAAQLPSLQQLVAAIEAPQGFTLLSSGDLSSFHVENPILLEGIPGLGEINQYRFDWNLCMIAYHGEKDGKQTQLEVLYTFPSDNVAKANVSLVRDSLTNQVSFDTLSLTKWSSLLTLSSVEQEQNLVVVRATTSRKTLIGSSFTNRDYYGWFPARKILENL